MFIIIVVQCLCTIVIWFLRIRILIDRRHFCVCKFEVFRGVGHLCNTFVFLCTIVSWFLWCYFCICIFEGFQRSCSYCCGQLYGRPYFCVCIDVFFIFFPIKIVTVLLGVSIFTIWIFQFEIGPTVWYFFLILL